MPDAARRRQGTNTTRARSYLCETAHQEVTMDRKCPLTFVVGMIGGAVLFSHASLAQSIAGLDTAAIEQASGLKGQVIAEEKVFKIGKPRTDVKIAVDQWSMAPFMGLGSWA